MRRLAAAALVLLAVAAVAGAGFAAGGANDGNGRALAVEMDEWSLALSDARVPAGRLSLTQSNTGDVDHELLIVRTKVAPDELPIGLEGVKPTVAGELVYGVEHSHHAGAAAPPGADHVGPGETRRDQVRLSPGKYVLLCGLEGHYQAGQRAPLTVE